MSRRSRPQTSDVDDDRGYDTDEGDESLQEKFLNIPLETRRERLESAVHRLVETDRRTGWTADQYRKVLSYFLVTRDSAEGDEGRKYYSFNSFSDFYPEIELS